MISISSIFVYSQYKNSSLILNNFFFQNVDEIDCEKIKEELMGNNNGGEHLVCNPEGNEVLVKVTMLIHKYISIIRVENIL